MSKVYIVTEEPYHDNSDILYVCSSLERAINTIPRGYSRVEYEWMGSNEIWFKSDDSNSRNEFKITERELLDRDEKADDYFKSLSENLLSAIPHVSNLTEDQRKDLKSKDPMMLSRIEQLEERIALNMKVLAIPKLLVKNGESK
jgi:hypothetical protein